MQNGLQVGLTEISDSFTMEEISAIARILAKNNAVAMGQHDAEEYINVIIEEKTKLNANDAKHAQTQEIQDYLARLKEQKRNKRPLNWEETNLWQHRIKNGYERFTGNGKGERTAYHKRDFRRFGRAGF